eukprot:Colp12_sorted_trinity150504_noHs@10381
MKVAFVHPDLGIGGAERLVVDAALALQSKGHEVKIYTAHHKKEHCFEETKNGTINVSVHGDWLPRSIFGRAFALCAYLRMIYLAFVIFVMGLVTSRRKYDAFICDQVSACIPFLLLTKAKVIFYCHFPDMLLSTERGSTLKRLYRSVLDYFEEKTTGLAHTVVVNSEFTQRVYRETFKSLTAIPSVVNPTINFSSFDMPHSVNTKLVDTKASTVFLSINRYERKKKHLACFTSS